MNWRDVPLPKQVAQLPRDKRGFPITFVAEWGSGHMEVIPTPFGWNRLGCSCSVGEGEPLLGHVCPERAWVCLMERRCGVCSRPIKPTTRAVFLGSIALDHFTEAPVHLGCGRYAAAVCPGISTPKEDVVGAWECTNFTVRAQLVVLDQDESDEEDTSPFRSVGVFAVHSPELFIAAAPPFLVKGLCAYPQSGRAVPLSKWLATQ